MLKGVHVLAAAIHAAESLRSYGRQAARRVSSLALAIALATAILGRPYSAWAMAERMAHHEVGRSADCPDHNQAPAHTGHGGAPCGLCCGPACGACAALAVSSAATVVASDRGVELAPLGSRGSAPRAPTPFLQPLPVGPPPASAPSL